MIIYSKLVVQVKVQPGRHSKHGGKADKSRTEGKMRYDIRRPFLKCLNTWFSYLRWKGKSRRESIRVKRYCSS